MCVCTVCMYVQRSLGLLLSGQLHVVMIHLDPFLSAQLFSSSLLHHGFSRQLQELEFISSILNFLRVTLSLKMARNTGLKADSQRTVNQIPGLDNLWKWSNEGVDANWATRPEGCEIKQKAFNRDNNRTAVKRDCLYSCDRKVGLCDLV